MKRKLPWIVLAVVVMLSLVTQQYNLLVAAFGVAMIIGFYCLIARVLWRLGSRAK